MTDNEKLEEAKRLYKTANADQRYVLEKFFPELAESEDDRIRKSIIEHLQCDIDDMAKSDCPFDFEAEIEELSKYIAWLEKQGKHKDYYTKQELIDMGFSFTLNGDIVTPDEMMEDMKKYLAWKEKQGEKFIPEDINEAALQYVDTCAVDGEITHDNVTEPYWNNHSMMSAYKAGWLKNQAPKSKWSEEDEHRLKDTIYFLDTAKKHYASTVELDACIDWLKSLEELAKKYFKQSDV